MCLDRTSNAGLCDTISIDYTIFKCKPSSTDKSYHCIVELFHRVRNLKYLVVVVVDQFWHFIAAYELFVLFFSSVLSSCTLSHVASLRMRRIFNSLDRSPLADSTSNGTICAEGIQRGSSHQGETTPIVYQFPTQCSSLFFSFFSLQHLQINDLQCNSL